MQGIIISAIHRRSHLPHYGVNGLLLWLEGRWLEEFLPFSYLDFGLAEEELLGLAFAHLLDEEGTGGGTDLFYCRGLGAGKVRLVEVSGGFETAGEARV